MVSGRYPPPDRTPPGFGLVLGGGGRVCGGGLSVVQSSELRVNVSYKCVDIVHLLTDFSRG